MGTLKWSLTTGTIIFSSPAIGAGSDNFMLYAIVDSPTFSPSVAHTSSLCGAPAYLPTLNEPDCPRELCLLTCSASFALPATTVLCLMLVGSACLAVSGPFPRQPAPLPVRSVPRGRPRHRAPPPARLAPLDSFPSQAAPMSPRVCLAHTRLAGATCAVVPCRLLVPRRQARALGGSVVYMTVLSATRLEPLVVAWCT